MPATASAPEKWIPHCLEGSTPLNRLVLPPSYFMLANQLVQRILWCLLVILVGLCIYLWSFGGVGSREISCVVRSDSAQTVSRF